ncbi:MAG TPA: NAD(P)H-binding protein [Streptosporangiaceae bacterium]
MTKVLVLGAGGPAWLTNADEVSYEVTRKGEPFKGTEVSRKSVAALVAEIAMSPGLWSHADLGVNNPGTDGAGRASPDAVSHRHAAAPGPPAGYAKGRVPRPFGLLSRLL